MTAQPAAPDPGPGLDTGPYETIHLGDQAAVVVPVPDFLRLRALERRATAEDLEEAELEAAYAGYRRWVTEGRPGAVSHEEMTAELLDGPGAG
jgi:hypothetical protein